MIGLSEEPDIFDEMERRIRSIFEATMADIDEALFDVSSRSLKPLYRIEATDDELIVTFDLPYVQKDDIRIESTEETLSIEARIIRPVRLMSLAKGDVEFEKYAKKIRLPVKVDPAKAKAKFRNGLLTVRFPIHSRGTSVRID